MFSVYAVACCDRNVRQCKNNRNHKNIVKRTNGNYCSLEANRSQKNRFSPFASEKTQA